MKRAFQRLHAARPLGGGEDRLPEVLLTGADHYSTLAAARSLGRAGVPVLVASSRPLGVTRWSRLVKRAVSCPDASTEPALFLERLLELGRHEPGRVLCATNDDLAWLYAAYGSELRSHYRLYTPPLATVYGLLNKWNLHQSCAGLGIATPRTWLPRERTDLHAIRDEATFPLVIKPQTQAYLVSHYKGAVVHDPGLFEQTYDKVRALGTCAPFIVERDPDVGWPIVQTYAETASRDVGVYSLGGFIDATGELFAVRASRKLLQWPHVGAGACFEQAPTEGELVEAALRLCRHAGFYGAFEVVFVFGEGRWQLVDFNPRFYGQMEFDVARGLDLPLLTYHAAVGSSHALRQLVDRAESSARDEQGGARVYCNRIELEIMLRLRRLAGAIAPAELDQWKRWLASHEVMTDAVLDRRDWLPGAVEAATAIVRRALHPRRTWLAAHDR